MKGWSIYRLENFLYYLVFIALLPLILLKISELLDFVSVFIFSTPFIIWFFDDINISIKEAFKLVFYLRIRSVVDPLSMI
jgi:hypothetical protein